MTFLCGGTLSLMAIAGASAQSQTYVLDKGWEFSQAGSNEWMSARVPCLVMGAAGDDAVHKCELLGVSMLLAKKIGLDLKNAQNSVAINCHSVHYTVGILHVLRYGLIVAQYAV